jgi:hypothetical protein
MMLISGVFYLAVPEVVQGLFKSVAETPIAGTPVQ